MKQFTFKDRELFYSDSWKSRTEIEYKKNYFPECDNIKEIVAEFLSCLFLKPGESKIKHMKIRKEISFWDSDAYNYVLIRYDQYGYFRVNLHGLAVVEFKASSGKEVLRKINTYEEHRKLAEKIQDTTFRRRVLLWEHRNRNNSSYREFQQLPAYWRFRKNRR